MPHSQLPAHVVVMGVSGSGKSTLARELAARLGLPFAEADDFHPVPNIEKMRSGTPLDDADRWPWLAAVRRWMDGQEATGSVVSCSALRRAYRDLLRGPGLPVRFVHPVVDADALAERMESRREHFMPRTLLPSQLATLEPLAAGEDGLVLPGLLPVADLADRVLEALGARSPNPQPVE